MKIRMYNVGFGDCFCLRDKNENFLVDFGTSNLRIGGQKRRDVFDMVIADLSTLQNKSLLLTNFHLDHLSGLLYLMKYRGGSYEFGKIYLPDVFSEPRMSRTLALLLIADLLKDSWLPGHQVSLYALAEALCRKPQKLVLLSRGKQFEKKYVALWPDSDIISQETEAILEAFGTEHKSALEKLTAYADKLRKMILAMAEEGKTFSEADRPVHASAEYGSSSDEKQEIQENPKKTEVPEAFSLRLSELEQEFRDLRGTGEFRSLMEYAEETNLQLRSLKHKLSIVFQNIQDSGYNLLFTGDITPELLQKIADNYDESCCLHEHYWCIKVPHHGTASHYFDFSPYTPENLLISGGMYHTTGKRKAKAARISPLYAGLFQTWEVTTWCSDSECCDGYQNGCTCRECEIIAPRYYLDIR
ncbi:MAG: hypothetical protein IJW67_04235 [Blautia sp.]|nr:hypothetical protein [Blautia sp.]